ncbi:MAG: hypothetical protein KDC53_24795, partial [Saprospiraceae bacterium]|nr:hypothetical protein [Saprospiraceae bacterium]
MKSCNPIFIIFSSLFLILFINTAWKAIDQPFGPENILSDKTHVKGSNDQWIGLGESAKIEKKIATSPIEVSYRPRHPHVLHTPQSSTDRSVQVFYQG